MIVVMSLFFASVGEEEDSSSVALVTHVTEALQCAASIFYGQQPIWYPSLSPCSIISLLPMQYTEDHGRWAYDGSSIRMDPVQLHCTLGEALPLTSILDGRASGAYGMQNI